MGEFFLKLRMLWAFVTLVKDPTKTDRVFALEKAVRQSRGPLYEPTLNFISSQEGVLDLYKSAYNPSWPRLEELLHYPDHSLGKELGQFMKNNQLMFNLFPIEKGSTFEAYLVNRARKVHDVWHVITGFDTSVSGEVGLQAFTLAQLRSPFSSLLIAGGLLHCLARQPLIFHQLIQSLFRGYQLGNSYKSLMGLKLEEMLNRDLGEFRESLLLAPRASVRGKSVFSGNFNPSLE